MDKNFDDETELWWTTDYYNDRIAALSLSNDTTENTDHITTPIL